MNRWKLNKLIFLSFPFSSNIRKPMKLALIGGGNMGGALLKALVKSNTLAASDTLLIEPDSGKRENLVRETGCRAKASMDDEIAGADCLLLAVKPQSATDVMPTLKPLLTGNPMLISVMAGVSMQSLEEGLGLKKLVRVMPNTPALVGEGMSVYFASKRSTMKSGNGYGNFSVPVGSAWKWRRKRDRCSHRRFRQRTGLPVLPCGTDDRSGKESRVPG